jgi:hypothetical protein
MNFYIFMDVTLSLSIEDEDFIPQQFETMNKLQICNWLIQHPNILHLSNEMLAANAPLTSSTSSTSSTSLTSPDNVSILEIF